jgi:hypothetical protein
VSGHPVKRVGLVLATVLAVALSGCGRDSKPSAATTTSTTAAPTPTTSNENAAVLAGWRNYWDVYVAVGADIHMPDQRLASVATGDELKQLGGSFLAAQSANQVLKGTVELAPVVTSRAASQATVRDCYLSHIVVADRATGKPIGAERNERTLVTATMVLDGTTWKVAGIRHEGDGCSSAG